MIPFTKLHGLGNDFVLIDERDLIVPRFDVPHLARAMGDRKRGVGSDGLILLAQLPDGEFAMRMWNPDGSESGMCGNGTRCVGAYLARKGAPMGETVRLHLVERIVEVTPLESGLVRVDMGEVRIVRRDLQVQGLDGAEVWAGNPHFVAFVETPLAEFPLDQVGPKAEFDGAFPDRANIHIASRSADGIQMRTWERGAGLTLACGSGACAVACVAIDAGLAESPVRVSLPGGALTIEQAEGERLLMTGPAVVVFEGLWRLEAG